MVCGELKAVQVAARTPVKELCARFAGQLPELYKVKSCFGRHVMTEVIDVVLCSSCPSECGRSNGLGFVSRLRFVIAELRRYYGMGYNATSDATRSRMERLGVKPELFLGCIALQVSSLGGHSALPAQDEYRPPPAGLDSAATGSS